MEREALLRSLAFISGCVDIEVVTDASTSVKKLLCKCSWNRHVHINMDTIVADITLKLIYPMMCGINKKNSKRLLLK